MLKHNVRATTGTSLVQVVADFKIGFWARSRLSLLVGGGARLADAAAVVSQ
jgi:hypothetical protein